MYLPPNWLCHNHLTKSKLFLKCGMACKINCGVAPQHEARTHSRSIVCWSAATRTRGRKSEPGRRWSLRGSKQDPASKNHRGVPPSAAASGPGTVSHCQPLAVRPPLRSESGVRALLELCSLQRRSSKKVLSRKPAPSGSCYVFGDAGR